MLLSETKRLIESLIDNGTVSNIAIRVGKYNDIIGEVYSEGVSDTTLFDMASVTKILSVTMISLISLERKIISLQDKVSKLFDVPDHYKDLTVYNLLTHTMGIGYKNLTGGEYGSDRVVEQILSIYDFPPSEDVRYSCPAFILMGKVLEKLYNKKLDVLFDEMIATPLGMKTSGYCPDIKGYTNIVSSNAEPEKARIVNDYNCQHLGGVAGNAGIFSCISDLTLFTQTMLDNGNPLVTKDIMDLAAQNHTEKMSAARGLGFLYVDSRYDQTGNLFPCGSIGHCGHTGTSVFWNRESGLYVIILSDATVSGIRKYGDEKYDIVMKMRKDIHNAVKADLGK